MLEAEAAFVAAEKAVATDPKLLARVKKARLPTDFVMLERWDELRSAAAQSGQPWPLPASKQQAFQDFAAQAAAERLDDSDRFGFCVRICQAAEDAVEKKVAKEKKRLRKEVSDCPPKIRSGV